MRGAESNTELIGIGAAAVVVTLLAFVAGRGCEGTGGSDPMDAYDHDCEQEYADANDGNDETKVETAILEQDDCQQYVAAMKAERQAEQARDVEEVQQP